MKRIKSILAFLTLWFVIHQVAILVDGLVDDSGQSTYIVVLGNTVNTDGTLSDRLRARVEKGKDLYFSSKGMKLFVSGGLGKEGFYEGSKMRDYLVLKGVPQKDIIVDDFGNNTHLTAVNFRSKFPNVKSVMVVSQYFHIARTKLAFRQVGIKNVFGAHADFFEKKDAYSLIREFFGYYKYLMVY